MLSPLRPRYVMVEGLERFVNYEPLRRVHECDFGVLARGGRPRERRPPRGAPREDQRRPCLFGAPVFPPHSSVRTVREPSAIIGHHRPESIEVVWWQLADRSK